MLSVCPALDDMEQEKRMLHMAVDARISAVPDCLRERPQLFPDSENCESAEVCS